MNGGSFVCSAAIVNTEGKDTVWTAGHCVHGGSGGQWATNWQFVPAYDDDLANPAPYGTWTAAQLWSRTAWINNSDFTEDMGVAIMNTRNGWHIVDYFGGHGFRANIGKNVCEDTFGYPAEWPFDGGNLLRCWGTSSPEWQVLWITSETIKIPCDMTRGESGGPWLHGYDGNWGYLNGINSRIDRIVGPTVMLLAVLRQHRAATCQHHPVALSHRIKPVEGAPHGAPSRCCRARRLRLGDRRRRARCRGRWSPTTAASCGSRSRPAARRATRSQPSTSTRRPTRS